MKIRARVAALLMLALVSRAASPAETPELVPPNIVFILADDWGWGDLSGHGHPWLKTPNLDRLAGAGVDFQQFNVLNPVCSPSRTAIITGRFPARYCIHEHFAAPAQNAARGMPDWLDPAAPSLPRLFKQAGYRTAHFGKWHLTNRETGGAPPPTAYGYDEYHVFNGGKEWPSAPLHAAADDAAAFIKSSAGKPFFMNVWLHESHTPHVPTAESMAKWKDLDEQQRVYAAVITDGDEAVGRILAALQEARVEENTLVIFTSDNGPEWTGRAKGPAARDTHTASEGYDTYYSVGSSGGLRGRKRSLFEGGVRVPFLLRWPGRAPAGVTNDTTVVTGVDMLPTLCAAAGLDPAATGAGDGENLLEAFLGKPVVRAKPIFWQWTGNKTEPDWWPRLAVREGDWKLVMTHDAARMELHNLRADRSEARDVSADHPGVVERLSKLALDWKSTLPAHPDPACIDPDGREKTRKPAAGAKRARPAGGAGE